MTPAEQADLSAVAASFCTARGITFSGAAGHGAFKATFKARDGNGRNLALKVYLPGAVSQRAAREVEAMAELSRKGHPSLPCFLDLLAHTHSGNPFIISIEEFLGGGNLTQALAMATFTRVDVVALARHLAAALAVVASCDLVHRDIKPDNIMFRDDRTAVLVDFGLVRVLGEASLTQTWLAQGPGTPFFSAPEQLNNEKDLIDRRTDQFGLGVTLAMAGYGKHPFAHPGDAPDVVVGRVAARESPDAEFLKWIQATRLGPIAKMISVWPVSRYRTPALLLSAWAQV